MKKLFFSLAALALVAMTACQQSILTDDPLYAGDEAAVTVNASTLLNSTSSTKATTENEWAYFLQVYLVNADGDLEFFKDYGRSEDGIYDLRLATGFEFVFAAWADYEQDYYNHDDLTNITIDYDKFALNDDLRDAFYGFTEPQAFTAAENIVTMELTRPFAKITVTSLDMGEVYGTVLQPTVASVTYSSELYTSFNALTGIVGDKKEVTLENNSIAISESNYIEATGEVSISFDYLLVPADGDVADFTMVFDASTIDNICEYTISNIPYKRNYITNVYGNLFTKTGTVTIDVNQEWEKEPITDVIVSDIVCDPASENIVYIITAADVEGYTMQQPNDVYLTVVGGENNTVEIQFESPEVAAKVNNIYFDLTGCSGTTFILNDDNYDGTVYLENLYGDESIQGDLYLNCPNGSLTIQSGYSFGTAYVLTASSTFKLNGGAEIREDLNVYGGRSVIDGTVGGYIISDGGNTISILEGTDYIDFKTSCVNALYYTGAYGIEASVNNIIGLFDTSIALPDFLDFGYKLNYAATVGLFNISEFNIDYWRNVIFTLMNGDTAIGSARLKEDIAISQASIDEIAAMINAPIEEFASQLEGKADELIAAIAALEDKLPAELYDVLMEGAVEVATNVNMFAEMLPDVTELDNVILPIGTIIPDADNFRFSDILAIIGTPEDEFTLTDASAYISGEKSITLYMLINLLQDLEDAEEEVAALEAEIAELEAQKAALEADITALEAVRDGIIEGDVELSALETVFNKAVSDYNALEAPSTSGGKILLGTYWAIMPAVQNSLLFTLQGSYNYFTNSYYVVTGTPDDANLALMNAKNAQIEVINATVSAYRAQYATLEGEITDIQAEIDAKTSEVSELTYSIYLLEVELAVKTGTESVYSTVVDALGIPEVVLDVLIGSVEYLEQITEILETINEAGEAVSEFNPWVYSFEDGATFDNGINGADATIEYEYATGKYIHIKYHDAIELAE